MRLNRKRSIRELDPPSPLIQKGSRNRPRFNQIKIPLTVEHEFRKKFPLGGIVGIYAGGIQITMVGTAAFQTPIAISRVLDVKQGHCLHSLSSWTFFQCSTTRRFVASEERLFTTFNTSLRACARMCEAWRSFGVHCSWKPCMSIPPGLLTAAQWMMFGDD